MADCTSAETAAELRFFGKMTASISHEIKNVMAIINESAGLLEDYSLMAEKGAPIDPGRLKVVSHRVAAQIRRADAITKNLNSLAHSVDAFEKSVGIKETLTLAVGLAGRFADMHSVKLDFRPSGDSPAVITSPFHLLNLIWRVIEFAMDAAGAGKTVEITFDEGATSVNIRFTGLEVLTDGQGTLFPVEKEAELLRILGATIRQHGERDEIILVLPKSARRPATAER